MRAKFFLLLFVFIFTNTLVHSRSKIVQKTQTNPEVSKVVSSKNGTTKAAKIEEKKIEQNPIIEEKEIEKTVDEAIKVGERIVAQQTEKPFSIWQRFQNHMKQYWQRWVVGTGGAILAAALWYLGRQNSTLSKENKKLKIDIEEYKFDQGVVQEISDDFYAEHKKDTEDAFFAEYNPLDQKADENKLSYNERLKYEILKEIGLRKRFLEEEKFFEAEEEIK